jgi:hypothetical protein
MLPAAIIGLRYDGTDLQTDDIRLEIRSGLHDGLDVRGKDITVPYLEGQLSRPRRAHDRRIVLGGPVQGNGLDEENTSRMASFRSSLFLLDQLFDPARDEAELEATLETGQIATINARPLPGLVIEERIASHYADVSITLLAVSPYWLVSSS